MVLLLALTIMAKVTVPSQKAKSGDWPQPGRETVVSLAIRAVAPGFMTHYDSRLHAPRAGASGVEIAVAQTD